MPNSSAIAAKDHPPVRKSRIRAISGSVNFGARITTSSQGSIENVGGENVDCGVEGRCLILGLDAGPLGMGVGFSSRMTRRGGTAASTPAEGRSCGPPLPFFRVVMV